MSGVIRSFYIEQRFLQIQLTVLCRSLLFSLYAASNITFGAARFDLVLLMPIDFPIGAIQYLKMNKE